MSRSRGGTCIITVGSTGTGKSSTIKLFTQQNVAVSGGVRSKTAKCALFTSKRNPRLPVWLDTVGWNDSEGKDDNLSFQELLHFINVKNITKVQAVIWTVIPNIRKDAMLQKQADFIDLICPGEIWNNVVIIAKAGINPEQDCQGALEAARSKHRSAKVKCLSYRYLQDASFNEAFRNRLKSDPELRANMEVVTEEEAYLLLKQKLDTIIAPVQVISRNKRCVDCGVVDDERLLPKYCHMQKVMVHEHELECYHPGEVTQYHLLNEVSVHSGKLETKGGYNKDWMLADNIVKLIPVVNIVAGVITEIGKAATFTDFEHRYTCCQREFGETGCEIIWECCKKETNHPGCRYRYDCCGIDVGSKGCERRYECCMKKEGNIGCVAKCMKCNALWGSASRECYIKSHNLITL